MNKAFILILLAAFLAGCQNVPLTGRSQLQVISEREETRMGLASFQEILEKEKLSHDTAANARLQRIGMRIAAATGRSDYQWEFKLIDNDKTLNAFCLPGGKVAVYTGLLPVAQDDAGLAAVIGHEVAHAIARHGGERLSQEILVAGLSVATVVATQDSPNRDLYVGLLGAGAAVGYLLPYSRLHESEADRMGLIYMAKAGYDPRAAIGLWQRMAEAGKGKSKPPEFLSTHPTDATRINELERWLPEALNYYRPVR
ncbi:MAG: M48 family metallopeptidase [Gammaproteobacteria bacterium]|nr:M48 family metallopeptidase [Rhodocyclaceae bacterium]MBU3909989.1 M48 family metallopeptidase [Gammaproteobacteria bacterium]MBU3989035.1 M48 family metallopeptidase [Gammaproteobacteria bacterium]MBU4003962.1 M48 family metallopeptidase [Gammaproteobacteria bacterium]MBU4020209.1 M48 family metallopeptidase [Gammaproteobacteria bacterium]